MKNLRHIVEMQGIVKRFPGVLALNQVDFDLMPGEVHMLLGENGAGKSTLIKILSGAYPIDEGSVRIDGKVVEITSPQIPIEHGVRCIYQEINLVKDMDVARNLFLGLEPLRMRLLGLVNQRALYDRAKEALRDFGIRIDPRERVGRLSVTQQKMVEIARALVTDAKGLILDEPTDVLEDNSRHLLFDLIRSLKQSKGVGFIYITHRYSEVHELGDRVTILRDGKKEGTFDVQKISLDQILEKMVGKALGHEYPDLPAPSDEVTLDIKGVGRMSVLKDINLQARKGEIIGVTGLMGAGKTELARIIAGVDPMDTGEVLLGGKNLRLRNPRDAVLAGIGFITEDRKEEGVILEHSIRDNYALTNLDRLNRLGWIKQRRVGEEARKGIEDYAIKTTGLNQKAGQLSGGNQQKVIIAKWLGGERKVLLFDEPTRGIDIGARSEIYRIMASLLEKGVTILMFTSDYQEAIGMSHRIIVLHEGCICAEFKRGEANEQDIFKKAAGV